MPSIVEIDAKSLALLLSGYMYPALRVRHFLNEAQFNWLAAPKRRFDRFLQLSSGAINVKFFVVPWMSNIEGKASLYTSFNSVN